MRILLVGAGGVGVGVHGRSPRAATSSSACVVADYDERAREQAVERTGRRPVRGRPGRRLGRAARSRRSCREHGDHARDERGRPAVRACRSSTARSPAAPTTSTWRCACRSRTPSAPYERDRASSSATSSSRSPTSGSGRPARPGRDRRRAGALRRVRALRRRPPVLRDRRARHPRRRQPRGRDGYDFAPSFSIWTTIEECLNPPVIWEKDRGWFTTPPFSEPEIFDFPEGIGPVECVNVEHEEVLLMPRWVDCKRATFKYGLGDEFIEVLKVLHKIGLDRPTRSGSRGVEVSPARRRRRRACPTRPPSATDVAARPAPGSTSPAPARTASRGRRTSTTWSTTSGPCGSTATSAWSGRPRSTRSSRSSCSRRGVWTGTGVLGPEAFDAVPFLDLLTAYGSPWGQRDDQREDAAS